jgi:heme/copper-type cytochrome/quinol oxidase subunit 2
LKDGFFQRIGRYARENVIIVGVIVSVLFLITIAVIILCCYKCRKKKANKMNQIKYQESEKKMMSVGVILSILKIIVIIRIEVMILI